MPGLCCCLQDSTPRPRVCLQQSPSCPARPQHAEGRRGEALAQPAPAGTPEDAKRQLRSAKLASPHLSWHQNPLLCWGAVLALAGAELTFVIVASMGLCVGFVLETALITQG